MTVVNRDSDSDELETSLAGLQVLLVVAPVRAGQAQDPAGRRLGNHTRCHRLCVQAHLRLSFVHSFTTSRVMAARSALCGAPPGASNLYCICQEGTSGRTEGRVAVTRDSLRQRRGESSQLHVTKPDAMVARKKVKEENENPRRTTSPASILRTDAGELPVSAASGEQVKPGHDHAQVLS